MENKSRTGLLQNRSVMMTVVGLLAGIVFRLPCMAEEVGASSQEAVRATDGMENRPVATLPTTVVIGSREGERFLPGSAAFIENKQITEQTYSNINSILRKVPGIYVREEDGFGNFPNISIRGVDGGRSGKVTIMEDGVLSAPAPYSAPSAYYSPNVGRMDAVEVLKGSSQVKYGPHTTGGVINFLSTPVPEDLKFTLKSTYGSNKDWLMHLYVGDSVETAAGRFGWLLESYYRQNDGFRDIERAAGFGGSDATGFSKWEPMIKLFWEPDGAAYQRLEAKFGYTDLDADETYLGLTEQDIARRPNLRYAGSRFDNITTEQYRTYLRYIIEPADDFRLTTTAYYNQFQRNWFKLNNVKTTDGSAVALSRALAAGGKPLDITRGRGAGTLIYRNNDRSYYGAGVDFALDWKFATGSFEHDLDFGLRLHRDEVDRFQTDEFFRQDASGRIVSSRKGVAGGGGNRLEQTDALAVYLQDRMTFGKLSLIPGARFEYLNQEYTDYSTSKSPRKAVASDSGSFSVFVPGIGLTYELDESWTAFGGVYKGFSVPAPRAHLLDGVNEETSIGYETGIRHTGDALQAELVLFLTYFDDLIVPDNVGAGGLGNTENAGEVRSYGAEFKVSYDPGRQLGWNFGLPMDIGATYTHARITSTAESTDPESIFSGARDGNELPYVPEYQLYAGIGFEYEKVRLRLDASYTPSTFTTASNTSRQLDASGRPDSRFGRTTDALLVDFVASYQVNDWFRVFGGIRNVLDDISITSRHPHGPRTNEPRVFYAGAEMTF